ncbi:MAG: pectinesterase family protein, partial [Gemmataceae bacterium]
MAPQRPSDRHSHPRPESAPEKAAPAPANSSGRSKEWTREWIVSRDDPNAFQSIKHAVRAAPPGAVIRVMPGLYQESVVIQKNVTIRGEGSADTVVLLSAWGPAVTAVHGANVILQGMLFRSRTGSDRHPFPTLLAIEGTLFLENCQIRSASGACVEVQASCLLEALNCHLLQSVGPGVVLRGGGSAVLDSCVIQGHAQVGIQAEEGSALQANGCEFSGGHAGIHLQGKSRAELVDCAFRRLHHHAIEVRPEGELNLRNCHIEEIGACGIRLETATGQIEDSLVRLCHQAGIEICKGGSVQIHRSRVRDCNRTGIHIHSRGMGIIEDCDIHGNGVAGILIEQRSDPVVRNCRIYEGVHACGILIRSSTGATIEHCDIHSN